MAASPERNCWTLAASVGAVPVATLVTRRSLPALPTDTVFAWLATEPWPIATELSAVTDAPAPIAVPDAAVTLLPAPTDAANVGQVNAGISTAKAYTDASSAHTLSSANAYTDGRMQAVLQMQEDFDYRLGQQDQRINREGAMQSAMSMMTASAAGIDMPNRLAAGTGFQGGEAAVSIGYQHAFGANKTLTVGGSVSDSESTWGVGYGVGW